MKENNVRLPVVDLTEGKRGKSPSNPPTEKIKGEKGKTREEKKKE